MNPEHAVRLFREVYDLRGGLIHAYFSRGLPARACPVVHGCAQYRELLLIVKHIGRRGLRLLKITVEPLSVCSAVFVRMVDALRALLLDDN